MTLGLSVLRLLGYNRQGKLSVRVYAWLAEHVCQSWYKRLYAESVACSSSIAVHCPQAHLDVYVRYLLTFASQ
jgi:hypothetical protein